MNNPVISALLPVVVLIAIGFISGRAGWIRPDAVPLCLDLALEMGS